MPSAHGTFRDVERRLPELAALGFDVHLPAADPPDRRHAPQGQEQRPRSASRATSAAPGRSAPSEGGHTAVHPELGTIADFDRLVESARELELEIALDYALQCSPDHPWVKEHPEWFFIRPDGSIRYAENPPKKYEDIYPLNFWCEDREGLWNACRDVFLFWIQHGVTVFRVDNPHTKPLAFWEWVIARGQAPAPGRDLPGRGVHAPEAHEGRWPSSASRRATRTSPGRTRAQELTEYLTELTSAEMAEYFRPNFFANTPDILHEYLQHGGRPAFRMRLLLAATLAPVYGIYSGYELCENVPVHAGSEEYLDSEKYEIRARDWDAPGQHQGRHRASESPAPREPRAPAARQLEVHARAKTTSILAYHKSAPGNDLLVVVNLDPFAMHETMVTVPLEDLGI